MGCDIAVVGHQRISGQDQRNTVQFWFFQLVSGDVSGNQVAAPSLAAAAHCKREGTAAYS